MKRFSSSRSLPSPSSASRPVRPWQRPVNPGSSRARSSGRPPSSRRNPSSSSAVTTVGCTTPTSTRLSAAPPARWPRAPASPCSGSKAADPTRSPAIAIGAGDAAALGPRPRRLQRAVGVGAERVRGARPRPCGGSTEPSRPSTGPPSACVRPDGRTRSVDLSQLSASTWRTLRPGERISLFGAPRDDRRLIANGFMQAERAAAGRLAAPGSLNAGF